MKQVQFSAPQVRAIRLIRESGQDVIRTYDGIGVVKVKGDEHRLVKRTLRAMVCRNILTEAGDGTFVIQHDNLAAAIRATNGQIIKV